MILHQAREIAAIKNAVVMTLLIEEDHPAVQAMQEEAKKYYDELETMSEAQKRTNGSPYVRTWAGLVTAIKRRRNQVRSATTATGHTGSTRWRRRR